jgi:hypothetical protein
VTSGLPLRADAARMSAGPSPGETARLAALGVALSAAVVATVAVFLWLSPSWRPLFGWAPLPRTVWFFPTPTRFIAPARVQLWFGVSMGASWLLYAVVIHVLGRTVEERARASALRLVMIVSIATQTALLLLPPLLSGDLYHYALFGRMVSHYGLNPYVTTGEAIASDALWPFTSWNHLATHYGPSFTLVSAVASAVAGDSVVATAIVYRALAIGFGLLSLSGIRVLARLRGDDGLLPVALYALNPLVLIETASSGHNEAVMIGLALLGFALVQRGHTAGGVLLLVASTTVKYLTGLALALCLVKVTMEARTWPLRARRALGLGALVVAALVLLYAPFWRGVAAFGPAIGLVSDRSTLNTGGSGALHRSTMAVFAAGVALAMVVASRSDWSRVFAMLSALSLAFVTLVFFYMLPWYVLPAIAFAVVDLRPVPNRLLLITSTILGIMLMACYGRIVPA